MLNKKLREAREAKNLRQKDVCDALGLSSARYSQYETGKRTPDNDLLSSLADLFDVTTDYLLGRVNEPPSSHTHEQPMTISREQMHQMAAERGVELSPKNERDIMRQIRNLHNDLTSPETLMLSGGNVLDEKTRNDLRMALEHAIVVSTIKAKKKFTPKKYRHTLKK